MKKIWSLKTKNDFDIVIKNGKRVKNDFFTLFYNESDQTRIGISIPKKFCNAVKRNYNKRQIKNVVKNFDLSAFKKNMVLIAKEKFILSDFSIKEEKIKEIFSLAHNQSLYNISNGKKK